MLTSTLTSILADNRGWGDGPGPWFLIFPLFWLTVLVLAVVWFRRRGGPPWRQQSTGRSVLAERYASGDISADEYRERLAVLKEDDR
jgi:putative membrane protein